ncbi:hypothetical protein MPER_04962, partial [Moniliophthora perniciosa FA553]
MDVASEPLGEDIGVSEPTTGITMAEWRGKARDYLDELMTLEGRRGYKSGICMECGEQGGISYRCRDCFTGELLCKTCLVDRHATRPFDGVEVWNGTHFERTTLKKLGLVVQLGHKAPEKCRCPKLARDGFAVVDIDSIQEVSISYCQCQDPSIVGDHWQQLLRRELYPGPVEEPYTAFTFRVLALFHALTLRGKLTMYDFYYALSGRTDITGTKGIK